MGPELIASRFAPATLVEWSDKGTRLSTAVGDPRVGEAAYQPFSETIFSYSRSGYVRYNVLLRGGEMMLSLGASNEAVYFPGRRRYRRRAAAIARRQEPTVHGGAENGPRGQH